MIYLNKINELVCENTLEQHKKRLSYFAAGTKRIHVSSSDEPAVISRAFVQVPDEGNEFFFVSFLEDFLQVGPICRIFFCYEMPPEFSRYVSFCSSSKNSSISSTRKQIASSKPHPILSESLQALSNRSLKSG